MEESDKFIKPEIIKENVTTRPAVSEDIKFLYSVQKTAMQPVREILDNKLEKDVEDDFEKYQAKFDPAKIQVIEYNGQDVGRLRVVRSGESIYVGGIQILTDYQGMGIGTTVFNTLIDESNLTKIPVTLEVHDVNHKARAFYEKLGFQESGKVKGKTIMIYTPLRLS